MATDTVLVAGSAVIGCVLAQLINRRAETDITQGCCPTESPLAASVASEVQFCRTMAQDADPQTRSCVCKCRVGKWLSQIQTCRHGTSEATGASGVLWLHRPNSVGQWPQVAGPNPAGEFSGCAFYAAEQGNIIGFPCLVLADACPRLGLEPGNWGHCPTGLGPWSPGSTCQRQLESAGSHRLPALLRHQQTSAEKRQHKLSIAIIALTILGIGSMTRSKDISSLVFCDTIKMFMVAPGYVCSLGLDRDSQKS